MGKSKTENLTANNSVNGKDSAVLFPQKRGGKHKPPSQKSVKGIRGRMSFSQKTGKTEDTSVKHGVGSTQVQCYFPKKEEDQKSLRQKQS